MPLFSITTTTCFNYVYIYIYIANLYMCKMNSVWTTIPTGCPGYHTLPTSFVWHPENMYTTEVSENSQDIPRPWNIRKWVCFKGFSSSFLLTKINYPVQRVRFQAGDGWRLDRRVPNSKNTKTHGPRHSSKLQTSAEQECIASLWAWRKLNKINSFTKLQEKKHNARASRKPTHPIQRMQRMVYSWKKGWR